MKLWSDVYFCDSVRYSCTEPVAPMPLSSATMNTFLTTDEWSWTLCEQSVAISSFEIIQVGVIKSPTVSGRCRINILATGCAELRHWVSALSDNGITKATLEAFAKFDYVTWPGRFTAGWKRLGMTQNVEVKLSELAESSVNGRLLKIIFFIRATQIGELGIWLDSESELSFNSGVVWNCVLSL